MDISTYKPLIAKTLARCSGKGLTPEQVASAICDKISSFEEDMALMGGKAVIIQGPTQKIEEAGMYNDLQDGPYIKPQSMDISERIGAPAEVDAFLVEKYTKEQLLDFAKNEMPSTLQVKPPEYDAPFEIHKFVESAPGDLGFVNIIYQPNGGQVIDNQRIGPTERIATTSKSLDADALTESILKQADSLYTKTKRVLTPKMPSITGSPGDLSRALSADAGGSKDGSDGLTMPIDGQLSQQWKSQRR